MELEKKMEEMSRNINKILELLTGNDLDPNDNGHIGEIKDLRERVKTLERWKDRALWIMVGMSVTSSFSMAALIGKLVEILS